MADRLRTSGLVAGVLAGVAFVLGVSCPTSAEEPKAVLRLDLAGCPAGAVLEWAEIPAARQVTGPPNAAVDRFFAGWTAPLSGWMNTPSCLKVVHEDRRPVLVNCPYGRNGWQSRALIGGKMSWRDYSVEAEVRLLSREPIEAFGECTSLPFIGVIARYQDLNRYYAWVIRPGGLALYRRDNSTWTRLAESARAIDPARFFRLKLTVNGNELQGFLDGTQLVAARDDRYQQGKAGVRFNADIRLRGSRVTMDRPQAAQADRAEADYQRRWAEARSRYAKPKVFKVLDTAKLVPGLGAPSCYPAHLLSTRQWHLVLAGGGKTVAMDLDGRVLWEAPVSLGNPGFGEPDAAGVSRIACVSGGKMVLLDGRTGRVLAEAPAPPQPLIYGPWRLGNLRGNGQTCYTLRTGNNSAEIIVYDERLRELFRHRVSIEIGHTFALGFWDMTGDSREEILAMEHSGKITFFTQDAPPPPGLRIAPPPVKWMLMSLPAGALSPRAANLITNGGFENLDDQGRPAGWQLVGKASLVSGDKAFAGKHSARVRFTDGMWQEVPVKPLVRYELCGMARHEQPGVEPGRFKIVFKDAQGRSLGSEAPRVFDLSPVEYRHFRFEMTAPELAATCRIAVLGRFTGSEWILYDELSLRPVPAP